MTNNRETESPGMGFDVEKRIAALRARLSACPHCRSGICGATGPDEGIQEGWAFEVEFFCGATIGIRDDGEGYEPSVGCPDTMDELVSALFLEVIAEEKTGGGND